MRRAAPWVARGRTRAGRAGGASASAARARAPPPSRRAGPPPPCTGAPRASALRSAASPATRLRSPRAAPAARAPACRSPERAPGRSRPARSPPDGRAAAHGAWSRWSRALLLGLVRGVEQHALTVALLLVELPCRDQVLGQLGEAPFAHARRAGLRPAAEHLVLERALHLPCAEDLLHFPHHQLEHADLAIQDLEHVCLERAARDQVHHAHGVLLAQPVDAADPLLEPHGIPGQVIVDDDARELEIPALPSRLGADQHLLVVAEVLERLLFLAPAHLAVELRRGHLLGPERAHDGVLRGPELREHDRLLALERCDR